MNYELVFTSQAQKDSKKLKNQPRLKEEAMRLLTILKENPFQQPPPYERLIGDLKGAVSRRINIQHRLVYQVYENEKIVKVIRMWTHHE